MGNRGQLLLLFGMPRSGTTWLGKLFDAHRQTAYLHEPDSVSPNREWGLLLAPGASDCEFVRGQVQQWLSANSDKIIASRPFFPKDYCNLASWLVFLATASGAKVVGKLGRPGLLKPLRPQADRAAVTVWKSIESLGRMAEINRCVGSKSIHILRHPCGHIASTLKGQDGGLFDGHLPVWEDWELYDKLIEQSGDSRFSTAALRNMTIEERLVVRWGVMNDYALKWGRQDANNKIILYEDLCARPAEVFREVLQHAGLLPDEQSLDYLRSSTSADDLAYYSKQKVPLLAAYRWKQQLPPDVQKRIMDMSSLFDAGSYYRDAIC